jgi:two-component sensor histidine kinase
MPIIYLSGYSEDVFIERAKITEPFGYVLKPPRTQEIISVIEMALYKSKMEKELKKHRDHLEELVQIRTAELTIVNEKLKREIEERTHTMESLNTSLKEKEILIKEVHHRVKNNLQMVSSLLRLQSKASGSEEIKDILDDCQKRIHSISLVHEKLYQTVDLTHIDIEHYIKTLVNNVVSSSKINGTMIDIDVKVQEIPLKPQVILPCGLIITELVSNAMKHAFKNGKAGKLMLVLQKLAGGDVMLHVSNTGIPLPLDFDIHTSEKLGLQLVGTLVEDQLEGNIEVYRDGITEFRITFNPGNLD